VRPSVAAGTGTGNERIYSFTDIVALKVAFELRKAGVTTSSLTKVVHFLRDSEGLDQPLAKARLVVSGEDVLVVKNTNELVSALSKPGQSCLTFVVDLPQTLSELGETAERVRAFAIGVAPQQLLKRPSQVSGSIKPRKRA
jgi:hypothetical protein